MLRSRWVKPVIWAICLVPLAYLGWLAWKGGLKPTRSSASSTSWGIGRYA